MGGLPTSRVNSFAVDPSNAKVMLVALPDGLSLSNDGGWTWTVAANGPRNVVAIAINPRHPAEVYAVTTDGTIVRSTDGGAQWNAAR